MDLSDARRNAAAAAGSSARSAANWTHGASAQASGQATAQASGRALPNSRTATPALPPEPELFRSFRLKPQAPALSFPQNTELADQYRLIRTRILRHPLAPHVVMFTSPGQGDGKTINSINIAAMLSMAKDSDVLLIGGDANGDLNNALGLDENLPGLSNVLAGETRIQQATVTAVQFPNLFILPCGTERREMPELLNSAAWPAVVRYARASFRYVIIDAPPCGLVSDYYLLESVSDAVALVVRPDHTNRRMLRSALEEIPREKFLGVLMNCYEDYIFWRRLDYYGRPWE
jgi:Mrp family chromosome partitioning ATPase